MKNPKPKISKKLFKKETLIAREEELEYRRQKLKESKQISTIHNPIKTKVSNFTNREEVKEYKPIDRIKRLEKAKQQQKEMMLSKDLVIDFDEQAVFPHTPNAIETLDLRNIDDVFKMDNQLTPVRNVSNFYRNKEKKKINKRIVNFKNKWYPNSIL